MSCRFTSCCLLSLLMTPLLGWSQNAVAQHADSTATPMTAPLEWLILPQPNIEVPALLKEYGLVEIQPGNRPFGVLHVYVDKLTSDDYKSAQWSEQFLRDPRVVSAQQNHQLNRRGWPNDPLVTHQWHHLQSDDKDLESEAAWSISKGGLNPLGFQPVVAIIEGFDAAHPELSGNTFVNTHDIPGNQMDDDNNGYVDDHLGWNPWTGNDIVASGDHGTAVAGMAGAASGNGLEGAGVAPDVQLLRIDIGPLTEAQAVAAYAYAHALRLRFNQTQGAEGAFVVATNASWGLDYADPDDHPIWCAVYDSLLEVGILNCAATANLSIDVDLQGDMPTGCTSEGLIAVTALDSAGMRGQAAYGAESIDLGAPGLNVLLPTAWDLSLIHI